MDKFLDPMEEIEISAYKEDTCLNMADLMVDRQRRFLKEIRPWVDHKIKIYDFMAPVVKVKYDGSLETEHGFTSDQKDTIRLLDCLIENARRKILEC